MPITAQIHDSFTVDVSREHDAKIFAAAFSGVVNGLADRSTATDFGVQIVSIADDFAASFCAAEDWPHSPDKWICDMIHEIVKGSAKQLSTDDLKNAAVAATVAANAHKFLRMAL